jgi:hypothetical protein
MRLCSRLIRVVSEMKETWLRTDEREDILASLRMLSSSCDAAGDDLSAWKWIVIGTHSALQGAMALHLGFGNDLLVATPESASAWLDAHENGAPYPETMMDDFLSLYRKLKKHEILGFRFKPNGTHGGNVRRLNRFRNQFVHFMPQGWSIELSGMPQICRDCLDVVGQLGERSLCMRWESDEQCKSFSQLLEQCQLKLTALHVAYTR